MTVHVGQTATRQLTLTADHVRKYSEISGDLNPLHFDEAFAAQTRFGRLVVQGGLTTGLLHALVAMDLPGPGSVFLSQNWKFTAPVFIGDTITAHAEVLAVHGCAADHGVTPSHLSPPQSSRRPATRRNRRAILLVYMSGRESLRGPPPGRPDNRVGVCSLQAAL